MVVPRHRRQRARALVEGLQAVHDHVEDHVGAVDITLDVGYDAVAGLDAGARGFDSRLCCPRFDVEVRTAVQRLHCWTSTDLDNVDPGPVVKACA